MSSETSKPFSGDDLRLLILEQSMRAGTGHIGSSLSVADIVAVLVGRTLQGAAGSPDRDRLVLSKGHAALALYAALHVRGRMSREELDLFCTDLTALGVHPEHVVDGIDFSTGSLGHGLSIAAGAALGARMQGSERRAFALLSDAELNEGSVWEAVMFAAHHHLDNLVAVVDVNGQQALGYTRDVLDLEPLDRRWSAFGWHVEDVDGHDVEALAAALAPKVGRRSPTAVLARTTFGRGVSFMCDRIEWHYWPMSAEQYAQALDELSAQDA
jgi:transketolase